MEERPAGRPAKTTPLYDRLKAKGAYFCARGGWERAAYFPRPGDPPEPKPSFRRAETGAFEAVADECKAVRERVGLLDLGGFTKLIVEGAGAEAWLDRLVCGRLPKLGRIGLTWTLNAKGGIRETSWRRSIGAPMALPTPIWICNSKSMASRDSLSPVLSRIHASNRPCALPLNSDTTSLW